MRGRKPKLTFAIQERSSVSSVPQLPRNCGGSLRDPPDYSFPLLEKGEKQTRGKYHEFCLAVAPGQSECVHETR